MTTWRRILEDLRDARYHGEWFCGAWWYQKAMPTFAQRISIDLKQRGYVIESRICKDHPHLSTIHQYRLVKEPEPKQLALVAS